MSQGFLFREAVSITNLRQNKILIIIYSQGNIK